MLRSSRRTALLALTAAIAAACLITPFCLRRSIRYYTDGGGMREEVHDARAALREVLWQAAVAVRGGINTQDADEYEPRVSPDGRFLVFTRGRPGGHADLWIAERQAAGWGEPEPVRAINSPYDDMGACFALAGPGSTRLVLYFYSDRPGGEGGYDIWASLSDGEGGWGTPSNLGPQINSPFSELSPSASADSKLLFFATNRRTGGSPEPPRWTATLRETLDVPDYDIYSAGRLEGTRVEFGEAAIVEGLSLPGYTEGAIAVSPHGDFVYFASNRAGGQGGFDLYRARLGGGTVGPAEGLGPRINTAAHELDPALSANGFELYFARRAEGQGTEDIFVSASREVFLASESGETYWSSAAVFSFLREVLRSTDPTILALILSCLVCLIFAAVFGRKISRLALLTRCFLVALLVHLVIALWMNSTQVHRVLMGTLGEEERFGSFEVTVENAAEEDVAYSIRSQTAETGGDTPPSMETGSIASQSVLAPRQYAVTPRMLELGSTDAASGALARASMATAVRPPPDAAPLPSPALEPAAALGVDAPDLPAEEKLVDPAVALARRDTARPEAPVRPPRSVEFTARVESGLPPADDVRPLAVSLEAEVAPESLTFDGRTSVPPPGTPEPFFAGREAPDAAALENITRSQEGDLAVSVAASRSVAGPERAAPPKPSALRLERQSSRPNAFVAADRVLAPAGSAAGSEEELVPQTAHGAPLPPRSGTADIASVTVSLPGAADEGATAATTSSPRPVAPETAADRGTRGSPLDVASNPEAARVAPAASAAASVLSPLVTTGSETAMERGRIDSPSVVPSVAPRGGEVERATSEEMALPSDPLSPEAARPVVAARPLGAEASPAPASARGPALASERRAMAPRASVASSGVVLAPSASHDRPTGQLPPSARAAPAASDSSEVRAAPDGAPLPPLADAGALASTPSPPRATRAESVMRAEDSAVSKLEVASSPHAARLDSPRGETEGVLETARADAIDTSIPRVTVDAPGRSPSHDDAERAPDPAATLPLATATSDTGAPVAAMRAALVRADGAPREPAAPSFSLERKSAKVETGVAAARVLVPLSEAARPSGRLPGAARAAPSRLAVTAVSADVASLPARQLEESPAHEPNAARSPASGGETSTPSAGARLDIAVSAESGRAPAGAARAPLLSPTAAAPPARDSSGERTLPAPPPLAAAGSASQDPRSPEEGIAAAVLAPAPTPDAGVAAATLRAVTGGKLPPAVGAAGISSIQRGERLEMARKETAAAGDPPVAPRVASGAVHSASDADRSSARAIVPREAPSPEPVARIAKAEETPLAPPPERSDEPAPRIRSASDVKTTRLPAAPVAARAELALPSRPASDVATRVERVPPDVTRSAMARRGIASGEPAAPSALLAPSVAAPAAPRGGAVLPARAEELVAMLPRAASSLEESAPRAVRERTSTRASPPAAPPANALDAGPRLPELAHAAPLRVSSSPRLEPSEGLAPATLLEAGDLQLARAALGVPRSLDAAPRSARGEVVDTPRLLPPPREPEAGSVTLESPSPRPPVRAVAPAVQIPHKAFALLPASKRAVTRGESTAIEVVTLRPARPTADRAPRVAPPVPRVDPSRSAWLAQADQRASARTHAEPGSLQAVQAASTFVPKIYQLRSKTRREEAIRLGGGSEETERAVQLGLQWLALHQSPDGRWSLRDYMRHLPQVSERDRWHADWDGHGRNDSRGGTSRAENGDTGATGLALLAFLGHGDTQIEAGPYQDVVKRGLRFLLSLEQRDGDLRGGGNLYMHAVASFAICEAFALTRDPELAEPSRRAIGFTLRTQNPDLGGWRYEPYPQGKDVDTSVFGWMLMAVKSARIAGIEIAPRAITRMAKYLESARMTRGGGRYAYQPGLPRSSVAMTAQGYFCQQILSEFLPPQDEAEKIRMRRAANESVSILLQNRPEPADQDGANYYYWYYATLALFQEEGVAWETWNSRMKQVLLKLQLGEEHGTAAGSWDPLDRRAALGGRLYSTAISILSLEVYYRYAPKGK